MSWSLLGDWGRMEGLLGGGGGGGGEGAVGLVWNASLRRSLRSQGISICTRSVI